MQAKVQYRNKAENLRRKGLSYRQIRKIVPVSKSSLSNWLRSIELTTAQKIILDELNTEGQKKAAQARHQQRLDGTEILKQEVDKELPHLLKNSFFTAGLALYWAEGCKQKPWNVSAQVRFSNSDPRTILLMMNWLKTFADINKEDITYWLHIHTSANADKARNEWSKFLDVPVEKFKTTYKKHVVVRRHKHNDYKGLIQFRVAKSALLNRRIGLWTKGLAQTFS